MGVAVKMIPGLSTAARRWGAAAVIVANAGSLVGTTAVTSILGYVYWTAAAHRFAPADVGLGAAALSAAILLGTIGMLGLGTLLMAELPRQPGREGHLISTSLLLAGAAGLVLGVVFGVAAGTLSPALAPLGAHPASVALFAIGAGLAAATLVLDQALVGLLRGELQFGRNALFAVVKLGALLLAGVWLVGGGGLAIYATWVVGETVSLAALAGLAIARGNVWHDFRPRRWDVRRVGQAALRHHALNLSVQAPSLALPVLVTVLLSATSNAYFYTAWMVASFVFVGPIALATALYASGSRQPDAMGRRLRLTLGLSMVAGLLANGVLFVAAQRVLNLFGPGYAAQGAPALRIMALAVFPLIVKDHYVTVCRIEDRIGRAALITAVGGLFELALAGFGGVIGGLPGISAGYVVAVGVEAIFMIRPVYRALDRPRSSPGPTPLVQPVIAGEPSRR